MENPFHFELKKKSAENRGRLGRITTRHGAVETPAFMPVGTQASVKTLSPEDLKSVGARIILANTYHLFLRPGPDIIREAGGLHGFMSWDRPILTDSGGFQVFSLSKLRKIDDDGVAFYSHLDGSRHLFTPEKVMEIQEALGADIIMSFDECPPYSGSRREILDAVKRTTSWAIRCKKAKTDAAQALFGIVQGGVFADLRRRSAEEITALELPGYAIGGLSVGEPKEQMYEMLDVTIPFLPEEKPRYLMGVGSPDCLWEGVARGIDLFDCVWPTRMARHGTVMTQRGRMIIRDAAYARDFRPLEEACGCHACLNFTRSYLRHLLKSGELLGMRLLTMHNVHFLTRLMEEMRRALAADCFEEAKKEFLAGYFSADI
ncbi:MAG: tRNA guanosine(34) transglycosylase Tgt [Bacillota bacterium]